VRQAFSQLPVSAYQAGAGSGDGIEVGGDAFEGDEEKTPSWTLKQELVNLLIYL